METHFKRLTEADIETIKPYFSLRPNWTCDSSFLDSYIWKDYYKCSYYIEEDGMAVQWILEHDGELYGELPLCRTEDLPEAFDRAVRYFNEVLGIRFRVYLADGEAVELLNLSSAQWEVKEDVDAADYLYSAKALRELAGKAYHTKKNHLNSFKKRYEGRYEYRELCCQDKEELLAFLETWELTKEDDASLDGEYEGICQVLESCKKLGVRIAGVYIDDKLEAFTMGTYNEARKMAIIHIEKANASIRGLYQYINQQFLIQAFPEAEYVNREDDVGDPGLRKAKQSYRPIAMVKKYRIIQK